MAKLCLPLGFVLAVMTSADADNCLGGDCEAFGASSMLQSKASKAATAKKHAEDVRPLANSSLVAKAFAPTTATPTTADPLDGREEEPRSFNDNECLAQSPGWSEEYTCVSSNWYCTNWAKDMHRCCSESCDVDAVRDDASCNALAGKGTCWPYPTVVRNGTETSDATRNFDSDVCLAQSPDWSAEYTCASSMWFCESWAKDMHRCCSRSCDVDAVRDDASCNALDAKGTCGTYLLLSPTAAPTRASRQSATATPSPSPTGGHRRRRLATPSPPSGPSWRGFTPTQSTDQH